MCNDHINVLFQSRFVAGIRFMNNILGKKKGIGNRFTEKSVIKIVMRFREKFLICFQIKHFAFPRTWLFSYVLLDESHVFRFLNKSFSMQIKNFSWGLSSDKKNFLKKKWYFYPHIDTFYTINVIPMIFPCKFSTKLHIHMFWAAQWRRLIDLST